jgi:hypothetical protein
LPHPATSPTFPYTKSNILIAIQCWNP